MTPLPKKKLTKARRGTRRYANRLFLPNTSLCPSCKALKLPHVVCPHCGWHHKRSGSVRG